MTILCGTDFSEHAADGLRAALALARRRGEGIVLVHVIDIPALHEALQGEAARLLVEYFEAEKARALERLDAEIARAGAGGVKVEREVLSGPADHEIVSRAQALGASLIVVAALGLRGGQLFRIGSTAERIAQTSSVPVIVVRDPAPFERWARGEGPLEIVVGVDDSPEAAAALRWSLTLLPPESTRIHAAHVYWPPDRVDAASGSAGMPLGSGHPMVELEQRIRARLGPEAGPERLPLRIVGGLGRVADHLAEIAAGEKAHLLVVGTHQRSGLSRLWHGSVSRGVAVRAHSNVAIVPAI